MRTELRDARPTRLRTEEGGQDAVWGVTGIMAETIVPDGPKQRRTRRRMRALRAMERLGLLEEENLIPTLARTPDLRWLAEERGGRCSRSSAASARGGASKRPSSGRWRPIPNPMRLERTFSVPGPAPKYGGVWVVDMGHS